MIDTTDDAIEGDLRLAETASSDRLSRVALKRAELRILLRSIPQAFETELVGDAQPPEPEAGRPGVADVTVAQWQGGSTYIVPDAASTDDRLQIVDMLLEGTGYGAGLVDPLPDPAVDLPDDQRSQYAGDEDADLWDEARKARED